jgi:hypothetical protein
MRMSSSGMTNDAMGRLGSGTEYGAYHACCGGGNGLGGEFLGGVGGPPTMPSLIGLSGFTCRNTWEEREHSARRHGLWCDSAHLVAALFARLLRDLFNFLVLRLLSQAALEQGEVDSSLVRRVVELRAVRLARRAPLVLISLRTLPAAHAHVSMLATERQGGVAERLGERSGL